MTPPAPYPNRAVRERSRVARGTAPDVTSGAAATLAWSVIRDGPRPGARNMALDHALARSIAGAAAVAGERRPAGAAQAACRGVVRLYRWARPTVSFGRNEPAEGRYSREVARELGIDWVRRPTGGRAVLHAHELTYAVVAPAWAGGGPRSMYRRINEAIATALRSLGAPVTVSKGGPTAGLDAGPCFRIPADGEVVAEGRKLVGSAQARLEGALLQHGSVLLSGHQEELDRLTAGTPEKGSPVALEDLLDSVDEHAVERAVVAALAEGLGGRWEERTYDGGERADADRLEAERYALDSWTWRR